MGNSRVVLHSTIDQLEFVYDEAGRPLQLIFNGRIYNYVLNLQGDVQQIRRVTDGVVVATYLYNAWGQLLQSTGSMAGENPIRYRGYFWCSAAEMYYLQSRFYDPVIGRFLNWDGLVSTGQGFLGFNMFAYCNNNPVMLIDPSGYIPLGWSQAQANCPAFIASVTAEAQRQIQHMAITQTDPTRPGNPPAQGNWWLLHVELFGYGIMENLLSFQTHIEPMTPGELRVVAMILGIGGVKPLALVIGAGANFYEYGFTPIAFYHTAVDIALGFGGGRVARGLGYRGLRGRVVGEGVAWVGKQGHQGIIGWEGTNPNASGHTHGTGFHVSSMFRPGWN